MGMSALWACSLVKTGSSTTPTGPTGTTPTAGPASDGHYEGADAIWVIDLKGKTRTDVDELLAAKNFTGQIVATGDTDPKYARDELVCGQSPESGKMPANGTYTLKFCNGYRPQNEGPVVVGVSVADAENKAKAAGYTGQFQVFSLPEYDESCKDGMVCRVEPIRWYLNQERMMTLYTNKKISISTPDQ
jgi:beta-lactam-binding protein with PASTA domain